MDYTFSSFATFLTILWFLVYWILGGVFFAAITLLRLGRIRKVRFSCLFTIWVYFVAMGAAYKGLEYSEDAIGECVQGITTRAETITAVFGCGFFGIFGAFLLGALAVTIGGFLIFAISRTKSKPWILLEHENEEVFPDPEGQDKEGNTVPANTSKFFDN